jgi:hypothetical protein
MISRFFKRMIEDDAAWDIYVGILAALPDNH